MLTIPRRAVFCIVVPAVTLGAGCAAHDQGYESIGVQGSRVTTGDLASLALANVADGSGKGTACGQNSLGGGGYETSCHGNSGQPEYWCADFVKWVWADSGIDVSGLTAAAGSFYVYGQNHGTLSNTPAVGDAVVFDSNGGGYANHVAIVTRVNGDGTIETVSGDWDGQSGSEAYFSSTSRVVLNAPAYDSSVGGTPGIIGMTISGFIAPVGVMAGPPPTTTNAEGSQAFLVPGQQHYVMNGGGSLEHAWWDAQANAVSRDMWGTGIAGNPVTFVAGDQQHVFARGASGTLEHWYWDPETAGPPVHDTWGSGLAGDPAALVIGTYQDVWAIDGSGRLQQWYWGPNTNGVQTSTWGSGVAGRPSVFVSGSQQHAFARGTSGTLEHWWWDSTTRAVSHDTWESGVVIGDPAAMPVGDFQDVWAIDDGGNLRQWYWGPGMNSPQQAPAWGSGVVGRPSVILDGSQQHVFARGTSGDARALVVGRDHQVDRARHVERWRAVDPVRPDRRGDRRPAARLGAGRVRRCAALVLGSGRAGDPARRLGASVAAPGLTGGRRGTPGAAPEHTGGRRKTPGAAFTSITARAILERGGRMHRAIPLLAVALAAGCGSSSSSNGSPGAGDGGGAPDDAGGSPVDASDAGGGTPPPDVDGGGVPPPVAICTAPIGAADVSQPTTVVGTGTAASCTEAALSAALTKGGIVTFACGSGPATITVTQTIELPTNVDTVVDGGGTVTIDGGGTVRILDWNSPNYRANKHSLTLQHITFAHGHAAGTKAIAPAPLPCSSGFYDGAGGALQMRDGVLHVIGVTFLDNQAEKLGPDVGGGAIYLNGGLGGVVVGSTFVNNSGSNSGAIGSLNSDLDVYDSTFEGNAALGFGANSDDASKCSVVNDNKQHQVGSGGNAGAIGIDGGSDGTHTFCGDVFKSNTSGKGALGGAIARTPDDAKQTTVIDRCLFDGNTGDSAGAAYFHNSTLTITASTFTGNVGQTGVGTIQADGTTFDFTNVTFYGNHATAGVGATLASSAATARCSTAPSRTTCATRRTCSVPPSSAPPT